MTKRSLNVSDTCGRIRELLLSNDRSLDSDDASEYDTHDVERVPSECSYGSSAWEAEYRSACGWEADYRDACGEDTYHDNDLGKRDEVYSGRGFDYRSAGGENVYQDNLLIGLDEFRVLMNESSSMEDLRYEDLVWGISADSTETSVPEFNNNRELLKRPRTE